jgi:hypothetical protein
VVYFPYEPYCQELGDLFVDGLALFFVEAVELLGEWSGRQLDVLGVLGDFYWDPQHVNGFPGKDVTVVLEEVDDRAFLFVGEHYPNANTLGCVNVIDQDILHVLGGLEGVGASLGSVLGAPGDSFLELSNLS